MSVIGSNIIAGASGTVETGYQIARSLRFNSADSAYLTRTFASVGSRTTWTYSAWVKRTSTSGSSDLSFFGNTTGATDSDFFLADINNDQLRIGGSATNWRISTQVFRDFSAFFHFLLVADTTNATAQNRLRVYINGVEITAWGTNNAVALNATLAINKAEVHNIGRYNTNYTNCLFADVRFIDGQALTPSAFGQTDSATGVWTPIAYTGTYGTNGFWLKFDDNSGTTATTLGKDSSGNSNNWTPNNFSVTAGAGNDSLVDSPTNYGTDTGAGGEVRGNYATINPIMTFQFSQTYTNGNLECTGNYAYVNAQSTICVSSGKWYAEAVFNVKNSAGQLTVGVFNKNITNFVSNSPGNPGSVAYWTNAEKSIDGTTSAYGATYGVNDVIGVAVDITGNSITFYKNGVSQGAISYTFDTSGAWGFLTSGGGTFAAGDKVTWNFGQRPFAYTAPSGFKALCTQNLPTPAIGASASTLASKNFDITTYTGTNTTKVISGFGFQPDFLWFKNRAYAAHHAFVDVLRGVTKQLQSSTTNAESTNSAGKGVQSFNSDGFTLGQESDAVGGTNDNTAGQNSYVTWMWKAGGAGVSNTSGTISSTVSANQTAGISIVRWTVGSSNNQTVGHGLGVAPKFIITKNRNTAYGWACYAGALTNPQNGYLDLQTTGAFTTSASSWNNTAPTSSVFTVGTASWWGSSTDSMIAYCFAEIEGFSKFGSYTGNGSADGVFVYLGFRPRFVMIKRTDTTNDWGIFDTARNTYNLTDLKLWANSSNAENSTIWTASENNIDILSNGFKARVTNAGINASGGTYIFMAFAEAPFNYARAR